MSRRSEWPWSRLSLGRYNKQRAEAAVLESVGVQALVRDLARRLERLGAGQGYRVCTPKTCHVAADTIRAHQALGIRYLGAKCYFYLPEDTEQRLLTWAESARDSFVSEYLNGAVLPAQASAACFASLDSTVGIRFSLKSLEGEEVTVFLQFDNAMLARLRAHSRTTHQKQSRRILSAKTRFHLHAVLEANSLATLLAMKTAGTITLVEPRGVAVAWHAKCARGIDRDWGALNLRAVEYIRHRGVLQLELAPNKVRTSNVRRGAEMNPVNGLLSNLGMELSVEIGSTELSVSELLELAPGTALELLLPPEGMVTLRAGEEAVAEARLVEEGERVMLQITKVLEDSEATNLA